MYALMGLLNVQTNTSASVMNTEVSTPFGALMLAHMKAAPGRAREAETRK